MNNGTLDRWTAVNDRTLEGLKIGLVKHMTKRAKILGIDNDQYNLQMSASWALIDGIKMVTTSFNRREGLNYVKCHEDDTSEFDPS